MPRAQISWDVKVESKGSRKFPRPGVVVPLLVTGIFSAGVFAANTVSAVLA